MYYTYYPCYSPPSGGGGGGGGDGFIFYIAVVVNNTMGDKFSKPKPVPHAVSFEEPEMRQVQTPKECIDAVQTRLKVVIHLFDAYMRNLVQRLTLTPNDWLPYLTPEAVKQELKVYLPGRDTGHDYALFATSREVLRQLSKTPGKTLDMLNTKLTKLQSLLNESLLNENESLLNESVVKALKDSPLLLFVIALQMEREGKGVCTESRIPGFKERWSTSYYLWKYEIDPTQAIMGDSHVSQVLVRALVGFMELEQPEDKGRYMVTIAQHSVTGDMLAFASGKVGASGATGAKGMVFGELICSTKQEGLGKLMVASMIMEAVKRKYKYVFIFAAFGVHGKQADIYERLGFRMVRVNEEKTRANGEAVHEGFSTNSLTQQEHVFGPMVLDVSLVNLACFCTVLTGKNWSCSPAFTSAGGYVGSTDADRTARINQRLRQLQGTPQDRQEPLQVHSGAKRKIGDDEGRQIKKPRLPGNPPPGLRGGLRLS